MPKKSMKARAALPTARQRTPPGRIERSIEAIVAAVVETVRIAVPAAAPLIDTGLVVPKLSVGESCAPAGLEVIAAVRATAPANPPAGVRVMVEVFPVVAPGATVTAVPLTLNEGVTAVVTITEFVPVALL